MFLPKYLAGEDVPAEARAKVRCPDCGRPLELTRARTYLVCTAALHGPMRHVPSVAAAIAEAWPLLAKRKLLPLCTVRRAMAADLARPEAAS